VKIRTSGYQTLECFTLELSEHQFNDWMSYIGSRGSWCMDLPNNAYIVLSPAHNLQVITIYNYLRRMGILCTWAKQICRFGLWIAQKCVWRPGSARTHWGSY